MWEILQQIYTRKEVEKKTVILHVLCMDVKQPLILYETCGLKVFQNKFVS
jgi:hypothetical protein